MADDIEELLDEVESKFIRSESVLANSQQSSVLTVKKNGVEQVGEELESAIHSICSIPEPIETSSIVPDVSLHLNKGPNRKCTVVYVGDSSASSGISGGVTQRRCKMKNYGQNKSFALQYFTMLSDGTATCNLCDKVISHGSKSHNLIRHIHSQHFPERKSSEKKKSIVWEYYEVVGDRKGMCSFCNKIISFKGAGTHNLIRHLRMLHRDQMGGLTAAEPMPNKRASPACATVSSQPKNVKIDRSLVKLVCKNYLPFTFLESDSFQKFVLGLNRSCLLPTRKILSTVLLDNYYAAERARIMAELAEVDYVALTIDGWTSAMSESYLSLTAHFINNNTELKSYMLDCFQYSHKQTGENLKERIEPIFREWAIKDKIVCVTSSNSYDAVEMAIRLMGVNHISCFAYILNRVVMTALVDIENIKTRIKRIVQHFKCNPSASKKLKYMQVMLGKEEPKLVNDVMPMWISTYEMFQRIISVKDSLIKIISQDYPQLPQLNNQIIDVLINTNKLLAIFKNVLEEISSEKKVSASEVIILVNVLINKCQAFLSSYSAAGEVKNMARTLIKEMRFFFGKIEENKMFAEATILDPRFKEHGFKNQFVCDATVLNIKQMAANVACHPDETNLADCNMDEPKSKNPLADSIWDDFDRDVQEDMGSHCATTDAMIETDKYLQEPMLKRMQDPLKWWHENRNTYPRLYELVKKRMCIAATSLLSERLFF